MYLYIGRTLGGFHHRVDHILAERKHLRVLFGVWFYPLLDEAMPEAFLQEL